MVTPQLLYCGRKNPGYRLNKRFGGPQSGLDVLGQRKIPRPYRHRLSYNLSTTIIIIMLMITVPINLHLCDIWSLTL